MEFLEEETRPRFLFQSRALHQSSQPDEYQIPYLHKPTLIISISLASILFSLSLLYLQSEPLKSIVLWFALSLLVGPFAPSSLTAGDIRVGLGPTLPPLPPPQSEEETNSIESNRRANRRSKPRKHEEFVSVFNSTPIAADEAVKSEKSDGNCGSKLVDGEEEREWSEGDVELLRKQMVKHPVGKPGRWEAIAEVFKGRHGVESVIKKAKSMGEKKISDSDSFTRFLKDRKPVDKRIEGGSEVIDGGGVVEENGEMNRESGGVGWSAGEDIALLNALKAFPKDVPMRWEKIAVAVPGKSKVACMKRVADLKRDFRSSKTSAEA